MPIDLGSAALQLAPWGGLLAFLGTVVLAISIFVLNRRQAVAVERLKDELHGQAFERETRFSRLHERRIEAVAEIHQKIVETDRAFKRARALSSAVDRDTQEELVGAAQQSLYDLQDSVRFQRIWLDDGLLRDLDSLDIVFDYGAIAALFRHDVYFAPDVEKWDRLAEGIPQAKKQVEERMKAMLGAMDAP